MRGRIIALAVAVSLTLLAAVPGLAITYGQPDGNNHPNVGALVGTFNGETYPYCSGTLISPTVFLTAAHCDIGTSRVQVTFDSEYSSRSKVYTGTFHGNPNYNQSQSDTGDIAVVVFDKPIRNITPASLPTANLFDDMAAQGTLKDQQFTSVGYGANEVSNAPGGHQFTYLDIRQYSVGTFSALNPTWLRISQNPARDDAGTCYGDSGGPNFLGAGAGETNIIASITVTGDVFCKSTNVTYRLDTASARSFLQSYVTLP